MAYLEAETPHRSPSALRLMRDSTMSRKKHDTTPVAEAAELAHGLLGEDDAKPLSETRADWIEILADTPAPDSRHIFSPAVGNLVCERIAAGETLNKIASEPGMPSRSTIDRWCTDRPEFKRQYDIAVQLRADGLLEETIDNIDDKKEIVTETTTEDEDGIKRVSKAFTKEGLAYAMARINIRYKTLSKMLPRKWGDEGHGLGEPAPVLEPPRNGDNAKDMGSVGVRENTPVREEILAWQRVADEAKNAKNMGNVAVLENHPLREEILAWQRVADEARRKHEARHRSDLKWTVSSFEIGSAPLDHSSATDRSGADRGLPPGPRPPPPPPGIKVPVGPGGT